jgi:hypothetical protein
MATPAAIEASIILRRVSIGVLPAMIVVDCPHLDEARGRSISAIAFPHFAPGVIRRGRARQTIERSGRREVPCDVTSQNKTDRGVPQAGQPK